MSKKLLGKTSNFFDWVTGLDQYGPERFGRVIFATIRKSVRLKGSKTKKSSEKNGLHHVRQ